MSGERADSPAGGGPARREAPQARAKIVARGAAAERVAVWRAAGERVALANGVFDLIHVGHVSYLEAARAAADRLVVGVNGDRAAAALKGAGRPVLAATDRALVIAALRCVDLVVVFEEDSADALLAALRPDLHAKGTDYAPDSVPERATSAAIGARIAITGDAKEHSTRELVARVRARHGGTA